MKKKNSPLTESLRPPLWPYTQARREFCTSLENSNSGVLEEPSLDYNLLRASVVETKKELAKKQKKQKDPKAVAKGIQSWKTRQDRLRKQAFFTDTRSDDLL